MSAADRAAAVAADGAAVTSPAGTAAIVANDGDSARAETEMPLPAARVAACVRNLELLWRLNPQVEVLRWRALPGGFEFAVRDEASGRSLESFAAVTESPGPGDDCRLVLRYTTGLRLASEIEVATTPDGARLAVTDRYPRVEDPQDPRLVEVDRSIVPWVAAIRRHLLARERWGRLPGWRWWNERFMLDMAPRSRRIVRLLLWISLIEFVIFAAAIVVLRLAD